MFGRVTIRLGIGPHSSLFLNFSLNCNQNTLSNIVTYTSCRICAEYAINFTCA